MPFCSSQCIWNKIPALYHDNKAKMLLLLPASLASSHLCPTISRLQSLLIALVSLEWVKMFLPLFTFCLSVLLLTLPSFMPNLKCHLLKKDFPNQSLFIILLFYFSQHVSLSEIYLFTLFFSLFTLLLSNSPNYNGRFQKTELCLIHS